MKGIKLCSLLLLSTSCFAVSKISNPYTDANGYCVVDIDINHDAKYVQEKIINVPDIDNHILRIVEIERQNLKTKMCNDDTIISINSYLTTDLISHDGTESGYSIAKTKNGDSIIIQNKANNLKKDIEEHANAQIIGRIIGGTGRLSKATGTLQASVKFNRMGEKIIKVNTFLIKYKLSH